MYTISSMVVILTFPKEYAKYKCRYAGTDMNNVAACKIKSTDSVKSEKSVLCPYHMCQRIVNNN